MAPIFFKNLQQIHTWSLEVRSHSDLICPNCNSCKSFTPHGWLYKKHKYSDKRDKIGKRIICNPNPAYGGCGKTRRLLTTKIVPRRHYSIVVIVAFIQGLISGLSISKAYGEATSYYESKQASQWWKRLKQQEPLFRQDLLQRGHQPLRKSPKKCPTESCENNRSETLRFRTLLNDWWISFNETGCPGKDFQYRFQSSII